MKFSPKSIAGLEKLLNGKLGTVTIEQEENYFFAQEKNLAALREYFRLLCAEGFKYYYITKPFVDALSKSVSKIAKSSLWVDIPDGNYCFTTGATTTAVKITNDTDRGIISCKMIDFIGFKNNEPVINAIGDFDAAYDIDKNDNGVYRSPGFIGYKRKLLSNASAMQLVVDYCFLYILFLKYAEIETKFLKPGQKDKFIDCKYVNETKSEITVLNCTWFTTLVKSDGFKVRGHLRLQPKKKDGQWTKELIWINEFEKSGYTAPARKLSQDQ